DTQDGSMTGEPLGITGPVHSVAFSPDGQILAAAGLNTDIRLCDTRTFKEKLKLPLGPGAVGSVNAIAFSPDGQTLAVATTSYDAGLTLCDLPSIPPFRVSG